MSDFSDDASAGDFDESTPTPRETTDAHQAAPRPGLISSASAPGSGRMAQVWAETAESSSLESDSHDDQPPAVPAIELTDVETRVLGAMIEKSFLTPDVYPMTTNALVTACNQKTNRDPVVEYDAVLIDSTLLELRQRNLVRRVHTPGSRATKHRQTVDEVLGLNEQQLAMMSVLMLRRPQTLGELRLRTERHDVGFEDLNAVDACLETLAGRSTPLVRELARRPGQKENRWQHLLSDDATRDRQADAGPSTAVSDDIQVSPPTPTAAAGRDDLVERVATLEAQVETLTRQLTSLADQLGESLE